MKSIKPGILAAAALLFSQKGYSQTTIRAIARKAKVTESSIHPLFDSKDGLLARVLEEGYLSGHDFVVLYAVFISRRPKKSRSHKASTPLLIVAHL